MVIGGFVSHRSDVWLGDEVICVAEVDGLLFPGMVDSVSALYCLTYLEFDEIEITDSRFHRLCRFCLNRGRGTVRTQESTTHLR
jgi:hypothetical protein